MGNGFSLPRTVALVAVAVWLTGCASTRQGRFYTLNSVAIQEDRQTSGQALNSVSVSIAPVEIPDYLDRPQIVTRNGGTELKLAEFDRWAGSLSDNIATVLAENLAQLLGSDRVFLRHRVNSGKADFAVALRVIRLDCVPGDKVLLKAQWTVHTRQKADSATTNLATFSEAPSGGSYEAMASAISQALAQVSRRIAREIDGLPKAGP
jgi:uncharacterized protein